MRTRVEIRMDPLEKGKFRLLEMRVLPQIGELLETDFCGTCHVVQVIYTPSCAEYVAIVVLQRSKTP